MKTYKAFQSKKSKQVEIGENLIPTEKYLDEQEAKSFRELNMSGLKYA